MIQQPTIYLKMSQVINNHSTSFLPTTHNHIEINSIDGYNAFIKKQERLGNNILTRIANDKTHIEIIDESGATIAVVINEAMEYLLSCV